MKIKLSATLFIILLTIQVYGQRKKEDGPVRIFEEKTNEGISLFGVNSGMVPYSLEVAIQQQNLVSDKQFPLKTVLEPSGETVLLATLKTKNPKKGWSFGSQFTYYEGDFRAKHDDNFPYGLPFQPGEAYIMSQGYNGSFSHEGKNAIDFTMPEGTEVLASRGGLVVEVKDNSNRGCADISCMDYANRITIYHEDGSFADYVHLKKKGSRVSVGDRVTKGQVIGLSGDTGFSSGPHLHFEVYLPKKNDHESVETVFEVAPGKVESLVEMESYKAF